ncbi:MULTISPECIES: hypothetical protein [Flavobacterium]|uniref:hypothetical protein n=1 Tax=Flavobacterium TaxID=237 RepID=UPI0021150485|nr:MULTISPECIES: hypothetical protein [Flavobacterium]UUF13818.1 hypothetical protein NLJ00_21400 [Flavobacterium panici]
MKSIILMIIFRVILMLSAFACQANINPKADYQNNKIQTLDTIRDEFNLKKKNIKNLINGKSPDVMLKFYEYYLQEKDISRADLLMASILKSNDDVAYRYKISLISYNYTSDAKSKTLFVSDANHIKEYRAYFLKSGISSLKTNKDIRAHYLGLVTLDSAYYKIAPDSLTKKQMGIHYNSLAWYSIVTQKLNDVEYYLNQSMKYDPESKYPLSNMPLLLLLKGNYKKAEALYIKLKDLPFEGSTLTFRDEFLEDLTLVEAEGIKIKNVEKIRRILIANKTVEVNIN